MKISIAVTLIITIAVFSFVSGYSISTHNKQNSNIRLANQTNILSTGTGTATAGEHPSATSGGYGSPSSEKAGSINASSPGYGQ
ncbi:MAG: hypothetical protein ACR2PH_16805 [Desulfobulbia bacterium]